MSYDQVVSNFQKKLAEDEDMKSGFLTDDNSAQRTPRKQKPRQDKEKRSLQELLMEQLIEQYSKNSVLQKKICKLQTELDTSEVKSRYLKLDLNNAQVEASDLKPYKMKFFALVSFNALAGLCMFVHSVSGYF